MSIRQARSFRKKATDPEKRLWSSLRNRKVAGLKFRRQHPVGDRIVDFFCAEVKLAIELDGSGHCRHFGQTSDLDREIELYEQGVRVLRFHNQDIVDNFDGVLNAIIYAVDPDKSLWSHRPAKRG
jgi:very-short-patch-repair endonuclease